MKIGAEGEKRDLRDPHRIGDVIDFQPPAETAAQQRHVQGHVLFPHARDHQLYLTLSEVMGNLEVLEAQRRVARSERDGRIRFEAV